MSATRRTQPYRAALTRAPSPVLDRMRAGGKGAVPGVPGAAGSALGKAMVVAAKKSKRTMPRL